MFGWVEKRDLDDFLKAIDIRTRSNKVEIGKLRTRIKELEAVTIYKADKDEEEEPIEVEEEQGERVPTDDPMLM